MHAEQGTSSDRAHVEAVDKLYMENTLLRVSGALFCHDAKRAADHIDEIVLNADIAEKAIVVRPDPRLGQPGPLAHKLFMALIKKHSDYGREPRGEVSFSKRELMRLIGRTTWGGASGDELTRALNEIHYAFVRTRFKSAKDRLIEHSFNIFPEVYLERAERETDPIETCIVTLAKPIVASLQDDHFTCLNFALMRELGTIGQALYVRLFFHFANLFDGHHRDRLIFQKRYDDICVEWLGGLKVLPHRSMIERDQLGSHLRRLVRVGVLSSYTIRDAVGTDGFVLIFRPGSTFFSDYDRFYRRKSQSEVRVKIDDADPDKTAPIKVAYRFLELREGRTLKTIPYVSSKEVANARAILASVPLENIDAFLRFALAEARKTRFDVQSLGGLRRYVPEFQSASERQSARAAADGSRRAAARHEAEQQAYDRFWRSTADKVFVSLPKSEKAAIERLARARLGKTPGRAGPLLETMVVIERARVTASRHGDRIPTLEQWRARRSD